MKLYTREQMIQAFEYGKTLKGFDWVGDMIDSLEAIELPSDEEIDEESPYVPNDASIDFWSHKEGFVEGAKWMRDKIGGNNE